MAGTSDDSALVGAAEVASVAILRGRCAQATLFAEQRNRGDLYLGLRRQPLLNFFQQRVSCRCAVPVAVGVDDNFGEVRIIETVSGALESGIVELKVRRPLSPEQPADVAPVLL
jgi:hypothetical protein